MFNIIQNPHVSGGLFTISTFKMTKWFLVFFISLEVSAVLLSACSFVPAVYWISWKAQVQLTVFRHLDDL